MKISSLKFKSKETKFSLYYIFTNFPSNFEKNLLKTTKISCFLGLSVSILNQQHLIQYSLQIDWQDVFRMGGAFFLHFNTQKNYIFTPIKKKYTTLTSLKKNYTIIL